MKNFKNLGQALTKAEQQTINGGRLGMCCEWDINFYDEDGVFHDERTCIDRETSGKTCSFTAI